MENGRGSLDFKQLFFCGLSAVPIELTRHLGETLSSSDIGSGRVVAGNLSTAFITEPSSDTRCLSQTLPVTGSEKEIQSYIVLTH